MDDPHTSRVINNLLSQVNGLKDQDEDVKSNKGMQSSYAASSGGKINWDDFGDYPRRAEVGRKGAPSSFAFSPDDKTVVYLKAAEGALVQKLYAMDIDSGDSKELCKPPAEEREFSLEEKLRRERLRQLVTGITTYSWVQSADIMLIPVDSILYIQRGLDGELEQLFDPALLPSSTILDARLSANGELVGFVCDSEVYTVSTRFATPGTMNVPQQITSGARGTAMTHGLADFLAEEEMDRYSGYWLSLDCTLVAFEEVSEAHIPQFRIMHQGSAQVGGAAQEDHHYPFAGEPNPKVKVGVKPIGGAADGAVTWLDLEPICGADFYLVSRPLVQRLRVGP
jgi:dipeptidyl-peptidase-4